MRFAAVFYHITHAWLFNFGFYFVKFGQSCIIAWKSTAIYIFYVNDIRTNKLTYRTSLKML